MAYTQTDSSGKLKITYTITPDLDTTIYVGNTVTISGSLWHNYNADRVKSLSVFFGAVEVAYLNISVKKNETKKFSITFQMPVIPGAPSGKATLSFTVYNKAGGASSGWTNYIMTDNYQEATIANYSTKAEILKFDVVRAARTDSGYVASNEGTYAWVKSFVVRIDQNANYYDFDIHRIHAYVGDDEIFSPEIKIGDFAKATSSTGYTENVPLLLSGLNPKVTNDYRIVIEIGKSGEALTTYETILPRAFANMHLAGNKMGGVAFGGFSNSTDDDPKFECFYKGYFPNGFDEKTCKMIGNILYPVGSIYMNTQDTGWGNLPEQRFGGTWRKISGGRFLLGSGTIDGTVVHAGDSGGAVSTDVNVPAHHHRVPIAVNSNGSQYAIGVSETGVVASGHGSVSNVYFAQANHNSGTFRDVAYGNTSQATGVSTVVKMIPPYYVVDMYERLSLYSPLTDT